MDQNKSFASLFSHCQRLTRTGSFVTGRICRGEYRVSYLLLMCVNSVLGLLLWHLLGATGAIASILVSIVTAILQIKLTIKRSHDIGQSGWYVYVPLFCAIAVTVIAVAVAYFTNTIASLAQLDQTAQLPRYMITLIAVVVGIGIRSLVRSLKVIFTKSNAGDNAYGSEPEGLKSYGNGAYRARGIILFILTIIGGVFGQPQTTSNYDFQNNGQVEDTGMAPEDTSDLEQVTPEQTIPSDTSADTSTEPTQEAPTDQ